MLELGQVLSHWNRDESGKNCHAWIPWGHLAEVPISTVTVKLDRLLIVGRLVDFGFIDTKNVNFILMNISLKVLRWSDTIHIPTPNFKLHPCFSSGAIRPSMGCFYWRQSNIFVLAGVEHLRPWRCGTVFWFWVVRLAHTNLNMIIVPSFFSLSKHPPKPN